jgi:FkbM family methyltransferase
MALNMGVSSDGRDVQLSYDSSNSGGTSAFAAAAGSERRLARTVTLDGFLAAFCIGEVEFVKIDCEGCEYEVLASGAAPPTSIKVGSALSRRT